MRQKSKRGEIISRPALVRLILVCLCCGILLGLPVFAFSAAGTQADPLVSKTWVDKYVKEKFDPLDAKAAALKSALAGLAKQKTIVLYIGKTTAYINGQATTMDVAPRLVGNYTMLPIRFIGEALGLKIDWDGAAKTVTCTKGSKVVILYQKTAKATINGQALSLAAPPVEYNNRILVPVRFISESFNCTVDWKASDKSVTIY